MHIQRVTFWCNAIVRLSHYHLKLARRVVIERIEGYNDLGDDRIRVRVGTIGVGAGRGGGGGGGSNLLLGAGDDGGALHEPQGAGGPHRLRVLRLRHRHGVGGVLNTR